MKKAVLISIRPKWCELIASGKKNIEVRKTRPRLEAPFKCYIYQTLPKSGDWNGRDGKVIGEFICDDIQLLDFDSVALFVWENRRGIYLKEKGLDACLSIEEVRSYCGYERPYGWHISNLEIYDKPKKLSDFQLACNRERKDACFTCKRWDRKDFACIAGITRPPQSWCYVEELECSV